MQGGIGLEKRGAKMNTDSGYEDLYIAIWKEAIRSETKKAAAKIFSYGFGKAHEEYTLVTAEPLALGSKEMRKTVKAIQARSEELCERLTPRIKELIYQETKAWPNNTRKTNKDPEYNALLSELKKEALEFAREEIAKIKEAE